jgi:hypothetical protein
MPASEHHHRPSARPPRATTDGQVLALWLHRRAPATRRRDATAVAHFQRFVGRPLGTVTPADARAFTASVGDRAPTTRARLQHAIRSLYRFAHRIGFLPVAIARPAQATSPPPLAREPAA